MAGNDNSILKIGAKFGIYDVVRELGHGGMGAVYLVRDPRDGTEFAAKVMYPEAAAVRDYFVKRFIREAEIAMTVVHPNLIRVYDVGRDPDTGLGYMLMDYVSGGSLKDKLMRRLIDGKGPFPVQEAVAVVRQVAEALDAAHSCGIVHRDVKPDNILFTADGTLKLADLGVAKVSESDASTLLTMSSVVVGTPAYMAPEQMTSSHAVDSRADVYSLGIVLWELLAGERPTAGASAAELMARAIRRERIADIRTKRKGLPPYVVELLYRMTDPRVERRIASPKEVIRFIAEWRERERRRMIAWLIGLVSVGGMLLLAVIGGGIWYIAATADERKVQALDIEISKAAAPTLEDMMANLNIDEEDAQKEKEVTPTPSEQPQQQSPEEENVVSAVHPANADMQQPPPAPQKQAEKEMTIDELIEDFRRISKCDATTAQKTINNAVNAARRLDPDLAQYHLDGKSKSGGINLSKEETAIYRRGFVFLRLELFRQKNARLPKSSEIKALLDL